MLDRDGRAFQGGWVSQTIELSIEAPDLRAVSALVSEDGSLAFGRWIPGPHGVQVLLRPLRLERGAGSEGHIVDLVLSIPLGVTASLIAAWLYDRLNGRAERLRIDRTEVTIEEGEIRRVVHEHIERG
jgi:hypothetical protein